MAQIPGNRPFVKGRSDMAIELDHFIVPSLDKVASAQLLADVLGIPWGEAAAGPFTAVYLNDGLTLDFLQTDEEFPVEHSVFGSANQSSTPSWRGSNPPAFPAGAPCAGPWT